MSAKQWLLITSACLGFPAVALGQVDTGSPFADGNSGLRGTIAAPPVLIPKATDDVTSALTPSKRSTGGPRGKTVRARPRPDYDPVGIRISSFTAYPELSANLGIDSNVFNTPDGDTDLFGALIAKARLVSDWSIHRVEADAVVASRTYAKFSDRDQLTYAANASGAYELTPDRQVGASVGIEHAVVNRFSVSELTDTIEPIYFDRQSVTLVGRDVWGPLGVSASAGVSNFDYKTSTDLLGLPLSQDFRDYRSTSVGVDLQYNNRGPSSLFLSLTGEQRRYRDAASAAIRDNNTIEVLTGWRSEITPLIRGQVGIGYITTDFETAGLKSKGGLAVDANLDYLVTELTTVRLTARRYIQNVSSATSASSLNTRIGAGLDHELYRNIILSADAFYEHGDYIGQQGSVSAEGLVLSGTWLKDRSLGFTASLGVQGKSVDLSASSRSVHEATATVGIVYRP